MKRFRLAIAALAVVAILPFHSTAHGAAPVTAPSGLKTSGTLTIGVNFGYPPMEQYTGQSGTIPTGADIDLGAAIAKKMGLKVSYVNVPDFGTIILDLENHKFDIIMSSMNITPGRQKTLNFVPYFNAGQSIVVAKGNPKHIKTLADLSGKTVSVQSGTTEVDSINAENKLLAKAGKPLITFKTYAEDTTALQQLGLGRVVAELTDYPVAVYDASQYPSQYEIAGKQFATVPYGIAIVKSNSALFNAVAKAFKLVQKDGEYSAILKKYHLTQGALK